MKKLLLIFIGIILTVSLSGQNSWANLVKLYGGVTIGRNGTGINSTFVLNTHSLVAPIDSVTFNNVTTPTLFKLWKRGVQQNPDVPASFQVNAGTLQPLNTDSIPLFGISGGVGIRGSQASFSIGADLGGLPTYGPVKDTTYIVAAIFRGLTQDSGTVTMGGRFYKHATTWPTAASTDMMSGVITLSAATNATTTGTIITHTSTPHFDVFVLYPGESCAFIVTVQSPGNIPTKLRGVVYGYVQNRKY